MPPVSERVGSRGLGFKAFLTTIEIGALDHSLPEIHLDFKRVCTFNKVGKIIITGSRIIFRPYLGVELKQGTAGPKSHLQHLSSV